jgi:hypothetical protein
MGHLRKLQRAKRDARTTKTGEKVVYEKFLEGGDRCLFEGT